LHFKEIEEGLIWHRSLCNSGALRGSHCQYAADAYALLNGLDRAG
jgi:hypothetical protein